MPERIAPAAPDYASIAKEMPTITEEPAQPAAAPPASVEQKTEAPQTEEKVEQKTEAPQAEEKLGVGTPFEKGFEQLTKRTHALRLREEAVKPLETLGKAVSPVQAQALARALASGDPMAAMTALGFSYADIAARVAGAPAKTPEKPAEEPEAQPEARNEDPELAAIKAHFRTQQQVQQKAAILDGIKSVVTGAAEKFKTVAGLEDFDGVRNIIDEMWVASHPDPKLRTLPSDNALENIAIAAEEYERRLTSGEVPLTKKQWEKLQNLTKGTSSVSTPSEATRDRPGHAPVSAAKTLTNRTAAPPAAVAPRPREPDYAALARELP